MFLFFVSTAYAQDASETLLYETESYRIYYVEEEQVNNIKYVGDIVDYTTYNLGIAFEITGSNTLYIDSYGGVAIESYILGYYIKNNNISVVVDSNANCISACAFAVSIQDDLEIRNEKGLLFHLPYALGMPMGVKLKEFVDNSNLILYYTIEYLMRNKFSLDFIQILVEESGTNEYVAIKSVSDLKKFKVTNDLDYAMGEYEIIVTP